MQSWYFRLVKLNFNSNLTQNFIIFLCVTERVSQSLTKIIAVTQSLDDFIHRNRTILITRSPCWFQSSVNLVNFIHRLPIQPKSAVRSVETQTKKSRSVETLKWIIPNAILQTKCKTKHVISVYEREFLT